MLILLTDAYPNRYMQAPFVIIAICALNLISWLFVFLLPDSPFALTLTELLNRGDLLAAVLDMLVPEELFFLLINMMGLWAFGRRLEDVCGHGRFLAFFLACGLVANLISQTYFGSEWRLGISGAVFGLIGAYLLVFPKGRLNMYVWVRSRIFFFRVRYEKEFIFSVWWLAIPMLMIQGFLAAVASAGFYMAHFGALIAGALIILMFLRPDAFARVRHRVPV